MNTKSNQGKRFKHGLTLSIVFTFMCLITAHLVLSDFGKIKIETTTVQTRSGHNISLRVYSPKTATSENKAPAVVFAHGLSTTKECYSQYATELARRGFVVVTPDMLNHGGSDIAPEFTYFADPNADGYGVYAGVRYVATLDYVDKTQIGVAGHSMGGNATNLCITLDNESETPLISAAYLVASNPTFKDSEGNWINVYGDRSVGLYYTTLDHVYFSTMTEQGPTSAQQFLSTDEAKSFVSFGQAPSLFEGKEVIPGHTYVTNMDGKQVIRRINKADEIHPLPQGGSGGVAAVVDFFQEVFVAPNYKLGAMQVWKVFSIASILALLGAIGICIFTINTLTKTKFFNSLRSSDVKALRPAPNKTGKIWFWVLTLANCGFAFLSISLIFNKGFGYFVTNQLPQQVSNTYALWACANGLFMLITSFGSYYLYGKKQGETLTGWGVKINFKDLLKSILLAIIGFIVVIIIVYIAAYVFQMDLRFYLWGMRDMRFNHLYLFFTYLPFYLVFGIAASIAINSAYYAKIGTEPTWANDLFFAFMNIIPAFVITFIGYYLFAKTGFKPNVFGSPFTFTYTINAIPVFPVAIIVLRRIFKHCNNPYIPGITVGCLLAYMQVSSVFTCHTFMFMG